MTSASLHIIAIHVSKETLSIGLLTVQQSLHCGLLRKRKKERKESSTGGVFDLLSHNVQHEVLDLCSLPPEGIKTPSSCPPSLLLEVQAYSPVAGKVGDHYPKLVVGRDHDLVPLLVQVAEVI